MSSICKKGSFPGGSVDKEPACQCRRCRKHGINPWVRKIPWRRKWQPTPVFFPGKSHGQRSLVGCSPHGVVKSQTQLSEHTFTRKAHYSVFSSFLIHCPKLVRNHFGLPESISQKIMAPHTSTLAWKIPWTEEPGMLQSTGSLRVGHD